MTIGIFGGTKKPGADEIEPKSRFQTDPELIKEYATRLDISLEDAKFLVDALVDSIQYILVKDGVVNIRRLGLFYLKIRKRAKMWNPMAKEYYNVAMKYAVKYSPSGSIKSKANNRVKDNLKRVGEIGEGR